MTQRQATLDVQTDTDTDTDDSGMRPPAQVLTEPSRRGALAASTMLAWLPGLALSGAIAALAMGVASLPWPAAHGLGALTLAIVLGLLVGNTLYPRLAGPIAAAPGVALAKQRLLRLGIVLYGVRLTFQDVAHVGMAGIAIDALVLASTFGLSWWAGTRVFGLDRETSALIGAGSAICGAAAVMATGPVVRARPEQTAMAVATVVVFGSLSMFLYPALYQLNAQWQLVPLSPDTYGLWVGSTVHEVAQVVAAGNAAGDAAASTAIIAKMVRVMMLAPFLLLLSSLMLRTPRDAAAGEPAQTTRVTVPWFAVCFLLVIAFNSLVMLPRGVIDAVLWVDTVLLAMAMAALGLTTHARSLRSAGLRPMALAALLFAWLLLGGAGINVVLNLLFKS